MSFSNFSRVPSPAIKQLDEPHKKDQSTIVIDDTSLPFLPIGAKDSKPWKSA